VALDITELVASERALRQSEERYRDFLAQTSEGIWRLELAQPMSLDLSEEEQIEFFYRYGTLAECSDAFAHMYGLAAASVLVGARLDEILPRSDPRNHEHLRTFVRRGYSLADATSSERDDKGRQRFFVNTLTGIVESAHLVRLWGTKRDVTEHEEAERALRASEERYRELFQDSQDTIFISTPEGRIIDINPAGLVLLGFERKEDLLQVNIAQELYQDPSDRQRMLELMAKQGYCRDYELHLKRRDGSHLRVLETTTAVKDAEGRVIALRGVLRDVTQQRQLEQQLLRAQRMEAVGHLAGGVAHDFNNLLTVINGRSDLLRTLLEPGSPLVREVDEIKEAGKRAAALTRQLLILSRRQLSSPAAVNLNQIIGSVENLLRRSIGERVELVTRLEPKLANIKADPSQVEQVLLNLALNARDAMPRGGRLMIETENVQVSTGSSLHAIGLDLGLHVLLRVEDTGVGIDSRLLEQIFEPFVTTKGPGEGTGLGLSTVYGIVQQSNGQIRVDSEPGRGACFEIFLPSVDEAVEEEGEPPDDQESPRGSETILLVEDEAAVRSLLRRFLEGQGYRVLEAGDGEVGLEQAEKREGEIDLLLTDLVMPGMGGFELARRLESRWPEIRILFMSGYSEDAVGMMDNEPLMDASNFLQKPFSTDLLARRVRAILEG
jgi:PAS domain S-box-containing protein